MRQLGLGNGYGETSLFRVWVDHGKIKILEKNSNSREKSALISCLMFYLNITRS